MLNYQKKKAEEEAKKTKIRDYVKIIEEKRRKINEEKAEKIFKVISSNETLIEKRKNELLKRMAETDEKLIRVATNKEKIIENKKAQEMLKEIDRDENRERMNEIQELKKKKMLDKIQQDYYRTETIMYLINNKNKNIS